MLTYLILGLILSPYLVFVLGAIRDWWRNRGRGHYPGPTLPYDGRFVK